MYGKNISICSHFRTVVDHDRKMIFMSVLSLAMVLFCFVIGHSWIFQEHFILTAVLSLLGFENS